MSVKVLQRRVNSLEQKVASSKTKGGAVVERRGRSRGTRRRTNGRARGSNGLPMNMLSPFDTVQGAKVPDVSTARSLTFRSRNLFTLTPTSGPGSDQAAVAINTQALTTHIYKSPTIDGVSGDVTAWGTATANELSSAASSSLSRWRNVSCATEFSLISAPNVSGGLLTLFTNGSICPISGSTIVITNSQVSASDTGLSKVVIPIQPGMRVRWVAKPIDNDAWVYTGGTSQNYSWTWLVAFVTSAASGTKIQVEHRQDMEWIPHENAVATHYASPAAPWQPGVLERLAHLYEGLPPVERVADVVRTGARLVNTAHMLYRGVGYNGLPALQYGGR